MGHENTVMGEDDRHRPYGEPSDADKPWQAPSDDEESELGDFVFPDESDEDFVFPDESNEGDTQEGSRNSPDTTDTATDPTDPTTTGDRRSKNPDDRRTTERRNTTRSNPNERRHTDSGAPRENPSDAGSNSSSGHRDRFTDSNSPSTDPNTPNRNREQNTNRNQSRNQNTDQNTDPSAASDSTSDSGSGSQTSWGASSDVPWKRDPSSDPAGGDDGGTQSGSTSEASSDPDPTPRSGTTPSHSADETTTATDGYSATGSSESHASTGSATRTKSDGGTLTPEDAEADTSKPATIDDDALVPSGPTEDQEMPLSDHIEEMVRRVLVVVVVMSIVSAIAFPFADQLINFIWYSILDVASASAKTVQPRVYHPLALILARLKVATLAGFVIALPVFVYQTYLFMRPGLYPRERRYYIAAIPTSLVLAALGVAFAFLVVLPIIFIYFMGYSQGVAQIAFGLSDTFGLMLLLIGFFALIFQIPLFIMLAVMMGVTSRKWLTDRRLYFWGGFLGLAFITNPDPTGMAPIIVAGSMVEIGRAHV